MLLDFILLQAETGGEGAPASPFGGLTSWIFIGAIFLVFYFFMIRPQNKKQKEEREFRDSLSKGDKVITIGGIYGKVTQVDEKSVLIEVDSGVKLKMEKAALKPAVTEEQAS